MAKRVERTRAGKTMTEAGYWGFIRAGLRSKWVRWPPRFHALAEARRTVKGKRHKYEYQCAICNKWWKTKEVEVDHYPQSCGSLKSYDDLPRFVSTLFCEKDNLRVVCKGCHKAHTKESRNAGKQSSD